MFYHEIQKSIVALRNEKGSYNLLTRPVFIHPIVALRNEKGSYNPPEVIWPTRYIVALRNEKGSYNWALSFLMLK